MFQLLGAEHVVLVNLSMKVLRVERVSSLAFRLSFAMLAPRLSLVAASVGAR